MKTKKIFLAVIVVISAVFLTSCNRYEKNTSLKSNDIVQTISWEKVVTDSVKNNMIHYFMIMGKDNCPAISEVLIHKYCNLLQVPDMLIKDIPAYHKCFYLGEQMIAEQEVHSTSGPTLWKASQVTFTLKVMDPVSFDQSTISIVTRDAQTFWQVVIIIFFLLLSFLILVAFEEGDGGWIIFCGIVACIMLYLAWIYLSYAISGMLSLIFIGIILWIFHKPITEIISKLKNKKEIKKA